MNEQDREKIFELVELFNKEMSDKAKIVYVDKTNWTNVITRRRETINDLFFLGHKDIGNRVLCINRIEYGGKGYKIHEHLNHVNLSGDDENNWCVYTINDKPMAIYYQRFCSPITQYHLYKNKDISKILKGQLMGQNSDSPLQTIYDVVNEGTDYVIKNNREKKLLRNASHIELLTRRCPEDMHNSVMENVILPESDNEIMVKFKSNGYYTKIPKQDYEQEKDNISTYYPVITYEDCKKIMDKIPKAEIDFTVIGLGSAGTGILDQVIRSTYFDSYMFVDFDDVEDKNLRNQWYRNGDIGRQKVHASRNIVLSIKAPNIITKDCAFQDVMLSRYKTKYLVSGFDNLECRLELLNKVLTNYEAKYLIDLRYLDYACSIYFIDLEDENQINYYKRLLEEDKKLIDENTKYIETKEEFVQYWKEKGYFKQNCDRAIKNLTKKNNDCGGLFSCESEECKNHLYEKYIESGNRIKIEEENSCIKQNFIDIYKYSSSFVFAAIREIENGNPKPFTHVETQTEVIPASMIVRK